MQFVRLPAEEAAVRRFIEDLWLPFYRELESTVDQFALADSVDILAEELPFRLDRLGSEGYQIWIAVDGGTDTDSLVDTDGEFAGYIAVELDEAPSVFDRPDRLFICDVYVRETDRGTGLATDLVGQASAWGQENGCEEMSLDPHVDNDRAIGFYEKLGFETTQYQMVAQIEE
jgi:ribosomal protein S18 acetylase RimI-like enzyme